VTLLRAYLELLMLPIDSPVRLHPDCKRALVALRDVLAEQLQSNPQEVQDGCEELARSLARARTAMARTQLEAT